MKHIRIPALFFLLAFGAWSSFAVEEAAVSKDAPAVKKDSPVAKGKASESKATVAAAPIDDIAVAEAEEQIEKAEEPKEEDVCSFNNNAWLVCMENNPLIDVPAEVGSIAFGGTSLVAGIPFVLLGQIFYFPFSGQKYFYPGMKQMYASYYDVTMNQVRYVGYYLIGAPMYLVKGIIWDAPVYLYESAFGAEQDKEQPYQTIR